MLDAIKVLGSAVAALFGWLAGRSAANNAPDMRAADIARKQAESDNEIARNVHEKRTDAIRADVSP